MPHPVLRMRWKIAMMKQNTPTAQRKPPMHPLTVQIITRDNTQQREIQQQYIVETKHPRWELVKIFWHALFHLKFR